jgi:hypothetical protein
MLMEAAETVLGYFGFDRTVYGRHNGIKKIEIGDDGMNFEKSEQETLKLKESKNFRRLGS